MIKKIRWSILWVIGYLLSPLSWWNDLFVNFPIAYVFAFLFWLINRSFFLPTMVLGYWLSNILGFVLMHKWISYIAKEKQPKYNKDMLLRDLYYSIIYSFIVIVLIMEDVIVFPDNFSVW